MHTEIFTDFEEFKVLTVLRIRSFTTSNFNLYAFILNARDLSAYAIKYSKLLEAISSKIIAYFVVLALVQKSRKKSAIKAIIVLYCKPICQNDR